MFEVAGTHFHRGVFELILEKNPPFFLKWIFKIGAIPARGVGLLLLAFSFFFSTSKAPPTFFLENHWSATLDEALKAQQIGGYILFGIAVAYYLFVFFFRQEKMVVIFDKNSQLFSVEKAPLFRFFSIQSGHVPFKDFERIEKIEPKLGGPRDFGTVILHAPKMPKNLQHIEFKVLTSEQFEYFPSNFEKLLGR